MDNLSAGRVPPGRNPVTRAVIAAVDDVRGRGVLVSAGAATALSVLGTPLASRLVAPLLDVGFVAPTWLVAAAAGAIFAWCAGLLLRPAGVGAGLGPGQRLLALVTLTLLAHVLSVVLLLGAVVWLPPVLLSFGVWPAVRSIARAFVEATGPQPGQVWWAVVSFDGGVDEQGRAAKDRPVLVLRTRPVGVFSLEYDVLQFTSQMKRDGQPGYVRVPPITRTKTSNFLNCRQLRTLRRTSFVKNAGPRMPMGAHNEIQQAARRAGVL